jgi:D-3-phosphoglycerate dehydrogenase
LTAVTDGEVRKPTLVYWGPAEGAEALVETVGETFDVRIVDADRAAVADALGEAWAFLDASMKVAIDDELLEGAPNLAVAATATTGSSHIDTDALERREIPLLTLNGERELLRELTPAAELTWLLVLACARKLVRAQEHVLDGGWDRTLFPGTMLNGRTLGIVGCGRIGTWVAGYGRAFGMRCVAYDPHADSFPEHVEAVSLEELLTAADVVTLHVHLTPETHGLLGRQQLESMKPGSILVNTSRGELVDEVALCDVLAIGNVAAAGVDVLSGEPDLSDNPLLRYAREHDNLLITPHIGGYSPDALRTVVRFSGHRLAETFNAQA